MSEEIKVSRPQQTMVRPEGSTMPQERMSAPQSSKMPWIILAVVVIILVVVGILFRGKLFGSKAGTTAGADVSAYDAVFLTNGQVYFGKLTDADTDYPDLKDIYYLQVGPQQGSGTTAGQTPAASQQSISLVKLGNELHGPVDEMHISRNQILFYEDLKSDGQVVKAIAAYKANPSGATPTPAQ